jgi:GT2 family glycosyltransferase
MISSSILTSILIPNWNGNEFLPRCLAAISTQTFTDFEVIVVDNASTDGSIAYLKEHHPDVTVIELEKNLGFAAANNIGARKARGKWLALLNNDAFPEPDWLQSLMDATEKYPGFSFFASQLVKANNPDILDGAGDVYHISGMAWRRYYNFPVDKVPNHVEEVFSPCAAAALYDREAYLDAGGFNEDFTSYHEDVDLGFRLRLQGHRCLYVPSAVVKHIGSASYGVQSDSQVYHGHRNLVWSYFQNMPGWLVWKYLPAHFIANIIFLVYYSFQGLPRAIWRSKLDALRGLPAAFRKRGEIQKKRKVLPTDISAALEHGWLAPYLLGFRARTRSR